MGRKRHSIGGNVTMRGSFVLVFCNDFFNAMISEIDWNKHNEIIEKSEKSKRCCRTQIWIERAKKFFSMKF